MTQRQAPYNALSDRIAQQQEFIQIDKDLKRWHASRGWERNVAWDDDRIIEAERIIAALQLAVAVAQSKGAR